jgi:hypothetical protein
MSYVTSKRDRQTIDRKVKNALTVGELITELQGYPEDAPVLFVTDYGDHCHTQQALPIEAIEEWPISTIGTSGYSHSGIAFNEPDEDEEPDDGEVAEFNEMTAEQKAEYQEAIEEGKFPVVIVKT